MGRITRLTEWNEKWCSISSIHLRCNNDTHLPTYLVFPLFFDCGSNVEVVCCVRLMFFGQSFRSTSSVVLSSKVSLSVLKQAQNFYQLSDKSIRKRILFFFLVLFNLSNSQRSKSVHPQREIERMENKRGASTITTTTTKTKMAKTTRTSRDFEEESKRPSPARKINHFSSCHSWLCCCYWNWLLLWPGPAHAMWNHLCAKWSTLINKYIKLRRENKRRNEIEKLFPFKLILELLPKRICE